MLGQAHVLPSILCADVLQGQCRRRQDPITPLRKRRSIGENYNIELKQLGLRIWIFSSMDYLRPERFNHHFKLLHWGQSYRVTGVHWKRERRGICNNETGASSQKNNRCGERFPMSVLDLVYLGCSPNNEHTPTRVCECDNSIIHSEQRDNGTLLAQHIMGWQGSRMNCEHQNSSSIMW